MGRTAGERASEVWSYNGIKSRSLPASFDLTFVDFNDTGDYQIVTNLELAAPIRSYAGYVGSPMDLLTRAINADQFAGATDFRAARDTFVLEDLVQANFDLMRDMAAVRESAQTADLPKSEVETRIQFSVLPVQISEAYFRSGDGLTRAQVTFSLDFSPLESKLYRGQHYFSVELLSRLLKGGPGSKAGDEVREDISFQVPEGELPAASKQPVIYQIDHFAAPGTYTLEMILRDGVSQRVSVTRKEVIVPAMASVGLDLSTPLLCESIRKIEGPVSPDRFRQGELELLPRVSGAFNVQETMHVYLQVYGVQRDAQGSHHLRLDYRVWSVDGGLALRTPAQISEAIGQGTVALYTALPMKQLKPGRYELEAIVFDQQSSQRVLRRVPFQVR